MSYTPQNPNGQSTMANSSPVVIASDQSAIPVTAASLPLPTGAAADGVDGTGITPPTGGSGIRGWLSGIFSKLATLIANTPPLGQTNSAGSAPVVIASDQSAVPVSTADTVNLLNTTYSATGPGASLNTTGYQVVALQLNGTAWSGVAVIEGSEDNSNWTRLLVINVNEPSLIDQLSTNGNYIIQVVTKYIRVNVLNITGTVTAIASGRSGAGIDMGSMLTLALDEKNNVALHTKIDNIKTDASNAIVESDCPAPIYGQAGALNQALCVIDTLGYESLAVELFGNWGATVAFVGSNDPGFGVSANIYGVQVSQSLQTMLPNNGFGANGLYMLPCYTRYIKIYASIYSSGQIECLCYLRKAPFNLLMQPIGQTIAAGLTAPGSSLTVASYNTNPVPIGGADSGNLARRILVDATGKLITLLQSTDQFGIQRNVGILPNNPQNQAAQLTQDVSQFEGQTIVELLGQILIEIKINNEKLKELPYRLIVSQTDQDDNNAMRNDPSLFNQQ